MWEKDARANSRGTEKQKQLILDEGNFPGKTKQKQRLGIVDYGKPVVNQPPKCPIMSTS